MIEINIPRYDECNFRKKRTENDYNKINIKLENKKEEENRMMNIYNNDIFKDNNENMNTFNIQNDNDKNKYPDYQSFLQIHPKENIEIPSIKYYNYIFNIGSPFN